VQGVEQLKQGTRGESSAVGGSAVEGINVIREEVRAASAGDAKGINSVRREAREGRVEVRPTASRTN
jgi:hypothetical protein